MKKLGLYLVLYILLQQAAAQQTNNWTFGWRAGINFNQSPAQPFLSAMHSYYSDSVTADRPQAISDCNGNLLYYIGGDSLVWNKQHNLVNADGRLGVDNFNNFFIPAVKVIV